MDCTKFIVSHYAPINWPYASFFCGDAGRSLRKQQQLQHHPLALPSLLSFAAAVHSTTFSPYHSTVKKCREHLRAGCVIGEEPP
eukprot:723897-Rhodomonas_salina.1